jgi:uncharacterized protein with FMN-binding domain
VGYSHTQEAEDLLHAQWALLDVTPPPLARAVATPTVGLSPARPGAAGQSTPSLPLATPTEDPDLAPVPAATLVPGAAGAAPPAVAYKEGTYRGIGKGGHGGVEVTLVIKDGLIVSAAISNCMTIYPCSKIKALPTRVIGRQSAAVDYISGASDSSRGFRIAVVAALAQAKLD